MDIERKEREKEEREEKRKKERLEKEKKKTEEETEILQEIERKGQMVLRSEKSKGQEDGEDRDRQDPNQGTSKVLPLITIGNTQVQIPLPVGMIKDIRDTCPKPRKDPRAAAAFMKRYCTRARMSSEDLQIIIQAVDPETTAEFDVAMAFRDAKPYEEPEGWNTFWGKLGLAWQTAYKGDTTEHNMSCKQNPGEDFYTFLVRLHKIYLTTDIESPGLFVSTAMNNGDPKITQLLKLTLIGPV